jgi:ABC-type nitrate/sulfonate/bicarbonate transport system substrate-binding protein
MPWEGVMAERKQVDLNAFYLKDFDIPYGYSPVLLAHPDMLKEDPDAFVRFLRASNKGFQVLKTDFQAGVEALFKKEDMEELSDKDFLLQSQKLISHYYFDKDNKWGGMQEQRWLDFILWLKSKALINEEEFEILMREPLFTNEYLNN